MGSPDMYVLLIEGDVEVCALGIFSNVDKAIEHSQNIGESKRRMWVEKFKVDDPSYEDEKEYVVWKSS
jgi:hypothetical protein